MGKRQQLEKALSLEANESLVAWRPVLSGEHLTDHRHIITSVVLGPTVYGTVGGETINLAERSLADRNLAELARERMPDHVNLVVITNHRVLWCSIGRSGNQILTRGSDLLATLAAVEIQPARVVLAKLRFVFRDQTVAEFDLPSDLLAVDFVADIEQLLTKTVVAH